MSANVDSMFSVREMPWHREGVVLGEYPGSWDEARKVAGLDWEPISEPVYQFDGIDAESGQPIYTEIPEWRRVAHSATNETLSLKPDSFTVIGNAEMGEIIEAVIDQPGVKYETAGSLERGRAVWALALLDEPVQIPGDFTMTLPYLALTNRHGGKSAAAVLRTTMVRIVCANTFRQAEMEGDRTGTTFSFVHRSGWKDRVVEARQAVMNARTEVQRYVEFATELINVPVTADQRARFVHAFIPEPPAGLTSERVKMNVAEARRLLTNLFESPTTAPVADTAYGMLQAGVEYLDHVKLARSWESKLGRTLLRPESLKQRTLSLVREVAGITS
jgi:phage/plasmid-like protein (TIGR03299 family)